MNPSTPFPTLLLIPTGIGCEVGGFAGDAIPSARLLAAASGCLITHPNVMNGASLYWNDKRIQYVEGFSIDRFACGDLLLRPSISQKVGVLIDAGLEPEIRQRHLQVIDGCRATLGLDIGPVILTETPLEISTTTSMSGASWGELTSLEPLLKAGERLKEEGATAIAVVTRFPDDIEPKGLDAYRQGKGVDLISGCEAVISHVLVHHLCIPCAHAPALAPVEMEACLDPRAAGEELGHTFLPCVLVGLSRAPDLVKLDVLKQTTLLDRSGLISVEQIGAAIAPQCALGGEAVLSCIERGIPLIVVSNPGISKVDLEALGVKVEDNINRSMSVFIASNYLEAAGLLFALREGISISSLNRPIERVSLT